MWKRSTSVTVFFLRGRQTICTTILLLLLLPSPYLPAAVFPPGGDVAPFRIGYYEGGPYSDYSDTMRPFIQSLMELGWLEKRSLPPMAGDVVKPYWQWLGEDTRGYLTFRPEDGYSAHWDQKRRQAIRSDLLTKLAGGKLDLVIAMGTWAGQDLANDAHSVPVLVMSTSDAVAAGIVESRDDSGLAHVTARVDPGRFGRQVRMFHRIVGFKTLGVAFENTVEGRIYSAVDQIEKVAASRGFTPVYCEVLDTTPLAEKADASCRACYRRLAEETDAVYATELTCLDRIGSELAEILREANTPSFAMVGSKLVEKGFLLSISSGAGYRAIGAYNAKKFAKILNGALPRSLKQHFEDPLEIAINLETARRIGFSMPASILSIAAEIYEE